MMLDVDFAELKQGFAKYLPLGAGVGLVVLAELGMVAVGWQSAPSAADAAVSPIVANVSNTAALGQILYTKYVIFFQASAMVLLTAMIGAIVLTLHHKPNVKRQKIEEQNARNRKNVVEIKKVPFRTGV
jgi:NADH-quinone oxidoreductase subunit J